MRNKLFVLAALLAAACGGDDADAPEPAPAPASAPDKRPLPLPPDCPPPGREIEYCGK